jgi:hypothetical protein
MITPGPYQGYLTPYLDRIVAGHQQGLSMAKIARSLGLIAENYDRYKKQYFKDYPTHASIRYVLIRLGVIPPPEPQPVTWYNKWQRADNMLAMRREGLSVPQIIERLNGPWSANVASDEAYVRRMIHAAEWRERHIVIVIPGGRWLIAEAFAGLPTKGRPLDMGGPRDQWIERDPWSDQ